MNGLTFLALIALAIGVGFAYRLGVVRARRDVERMQAARNTASQPPMTPSSSPPRMPMALADRGAPRIAPAEQAQLRAFADDRAALFRELADARTQIAHYRQVVVDIERNAPPPLLDVPGSPDDLKLIVGVGPVIERMLYQLGIATYRQIARLSERDIDDIDARLPEFPGRIRRDGWVTQARALHVAKYGTNP